MSFSLYYIIVATILLHQYHTIACICQPHYHTHEILYPNCLKTNVIIMPVDQTNKAYKSNVGQDFGNIQSMSMVTTQSFIDCK